MKTKVYFHYEPKEDLQAITITVTVDEETLLEAATSQFIQSIQAINSIYNSVKPSHCLIKSENGKVLSIKSKKPLLDLIEDDRDIFITIDQVFLEEKPVEVVKQPVPPQQQGNSELEQTITLLKEFMNKRLYKRGKLLCEKIISTSTNAINVNHLDLSDNSSYQEEMIYAFQCLMEIHYHAKRYDETVRLGHQLIYLLQKDPQTTSSHSTPSTSNKAASSSSSTDKNNNSNSKDGNNNNNNNKENVVMFEKFNKVSLKKFLANMKTVQYFEIFYIIARTYYELKFYQKCLDVISITIDLYQTNIFSLSSLSNYNTATTTTTTAKTVAGGSGKTTTKSSSSSTTSSKDLNKMKLNKHKIHFLLNMIALQAESTYLLGEHIQAANILNQIMDNPFADSNLLILKTYILFTFQYFKYNETMAAVLKTIAIIGTESKKISMISQGHSLNPQLSLATSLSSPQHGVNAPDKNSQSQSAASAMPSSASLNSEEKSISSRLRLGQRPPSEHMKQRDENYLNQQDSDDELDAHFQIYNYEFSSQMKLIKQLVIKFLLTKEGYDQLLKRLPPNSRGTAEIYGYLATIAKEFSAIDLAVKLYELSLQIQPNCINYALNLVHIYELSFDYNTCLEIIQIFCAKNLNLSIGKDRIQSNKFLFTCSDLVNIMKYNIHLQSTYFNAGEQREGSGKKTGSTSESTSVDQNSSNSNPNKYLYFKVLWYNNTTTSISNVENLAINDLHNNGFAVVEKYTFAKEFLQNQANSRIPKITLLDSIDDEDDKIFGSLSSALKPGNTEALKPSSVLFYDRELDLIALIATMVKIYFLQGNLFIIPLIIDKLEIIRHLSLKPLHKTLIRNELAYYQDVIQILAYRTQFGWHGLQYLVDEGSSEPLNNPSDSSISLPSQLIMEYSLSNLLTTPSHPLLVSAKEKPIYICGDSHCLSLSWNIVKRKSASGVISHSLIVPKLVTGVKQWHLRNESTFYPRQNFYNAMTESIPKGSEVIMCIGEIDCREGFLVALERDYYDNIEEAMVSTIKGFAHTLKSLQASRQLKLFIHPIPPVLNETRKIVMLFNTLYKEVITDMNDPNITWLEFLYDLVDLTSPSAPPSASAAQIAKSILNEEYSLKEIYRHDGTHLHPRYVSLVESALNACKK